MAATMRPGKVLAVYVLLILFTFGPILLALLAGAIAIACGATVNEAGPNPCIVMGVDIGGLLCGMVVMGWLGIGTIPLGLFGILIYSLVLLYRWWLGMPSGRHAGGR